MQKGLFGCIAILLLILSAQAQDTQLCKLPASLDQLKAKAIETADINLDSNMLQLAGNAMSREDSRETEARKALSGIKGICVRSYKFEKGVQYIEKDIDALRTEFREPVWSSMVKVRNNRGGENVDVLFKTEKGSFAGVVILVIKPEEFTFVRIDGPINLAQLAKLGGQFGVPKLDASDSAKPASKKESR